jgi:hypothetical protein
MTEIAQNDHKGQSDLDALRELLLAAIEQVKPTRLFVYRVDIATMPCKDLVQRVIRHRGEQASAVFHTKLGAELARRGKERAVLQRAVRNGNGAHLHD